MPFVKGQPRPARGGRKKGSVNKAPLELKRAILEAFDVAGGVDYLRWLSKKYPQAFTTLLGKILPTQITGEDGGAIRVKFVEAMIDSPNSRKVGSALPDAVPVHSLNGSVPGLRGGPGVGEDQSGSH